MLGSTRFVSFMFSLLLVHMMLLITLSIDSSIFAEVARWAYGFLGSFGFVIGGSKIAEKWRSNG